MTVAIQGPSPAALTAGILLLSRARSFGQRLDVEIVGDPGDVAEVRGPALLYGPVLASCGVGRRAGAAGALLVVPGPPTEPVALSLARDGTGEWFLVDRAGRGEHLATRAFVGLCRARDPERRALGDALRRALTAVGIPSEPAVVDLLFGAPAPPLARLALALRAGRAMAEHQGSPLGRYLRGGAEPAGALPSPCRPGDVAAARADGRIDALLQGIAPAVREDVAAWAEGLGALAARDEGAATLLCALADLGAHLLALPGGAAALPPLPPAEDAVAAGLGAALGAVGDDGDAARALVRTFRFLGGRFVPEARWPVRLGGAPPPAGRLERWAWFAAEARRAADGLDALWRRVSDPPQ